MKRLCISLIIFITVLIIPGCFETDVDVIPINKAQKIPGIVGTYCEVSNGKLDKRKIYSVTKNPKNNEYTFKNKQYRAILIRQGIYLVQENDGRNKKNNLFYVEISDNKINQFYGNIWSGDLKKMLQLAKRLNVKIVAGEIYGSQSNILKLMTIIGNKITDKKTKYKLKISKTYAKTVEPIPRDLQRFASHKAGDIIKECKYVISSKATWEGDCIIARDTEGKLDKFPYKNGAFTTLDNNYNTHCVIVLNLSNKIGLKFYPNRDTVELVDIDAKDFMDLVDKDISKCVTFRDSISFDSWVKSGGSIDFLKKYQLLPSSEMESKLRKINRNNYENNIFARKLVGAGQRMSNTEKFALMLASAGISLAGVSVMTRGLLKITGTTGPSQPSPSSIAGACGNVHIQFSGQWFWGTIKSVTVELTNKDNLIKYAGAGSWDSVDFFELPFGGYEFVINAFEKSGLSGQQHTLKGTFSHNCKSNQIYIDAGGGFIDPSIHLYCN